MASNQSQPNRPAQPNRADPKDPRQRPPTYPQPTYPPLPNSSYLPASTPRRPYPPTYLRKRSRIPKIDLGCLIPALFVLASVGLLLGVYFLFPAQTNILLLGMDYADPWTALGRTDTMILSTFNPWRPYVGLLSIPRDLWVTIPGIGENRINTAHYFAEAQTPGSGPAASMVTIQQNFGVMPDYFIRLRFESFKDVINAMGGVDITLDQPTAGYPAGNHHLTANKALAFARDRANTDDFFRMGQGQILVKAMIQKMKNPLTWPRLPGILYALGKSVDSNVPVWLWPRLIFAALRVGSNGLDFHTISREMVTPFTTDQGASVLAPNWPQIHLLVDEMFHH